MISKLELGRSSFGAEDDHHQDGEPPAASHSESAEAKSETSPILGMMLVRQAVEARNNLCNADGPAERQLIFAANSQYWLSMRGVFDKGKKKRQEEEIAGGVTNINLKDAFLSDSLDNIAMGFCEEAAVLWEGQAIGDAKEGNYSLNYYHQAKEIDCGGRDPSEHNQSASWVRLAAQFTANQYAQDYLHGNPEIGPDSIWGDFLPRPGKSELRDSQQELSDKLQANEGLREDFRLLQSKAPSPEYWKSFRGFTKGLLKSLSGAYEKAHDCYGERIREEDQGFECAIVGRAALAAVTS